MVKQQQPHEVFADTIREAIAGGAAVVASGDLPELTIKVHIAQVNEPEEEDNGDLRGTIKLHVEFEPPLDTLA